MADGSRGDVERAAQAVTWSLPGLTFLAIAAAWSWGWSALLLWHTHNAPLAVPGFYVGMSGLGPTLAGLCCVLLAESEAGVQRLVRQVFTPHAAAAWLFVPLAALPAVAVTLILEASSPGGSFAGVFRSWLKAVVPGAAGASAAAARVTLGRAASAGLGISLGLVGGWQGFLTTHILRSYSPVRGALALGWLAAVWQYVPSLALHVLTLGGSTSSRGAQWSDSVDFQVAATLAALDSLAWIPNSALLMALYLSTRGSLLVCAAWHTVLAAARILFTNAGSSGGVDSPVVTAALLLLATNAAALPAWVWLWREGFKSRRRAGRLSPSVAGDSSMSTSRQEAQKEE